MNYYKHFSTLERICLADLLEKGFSLRKISKILQRNPSSISREIARNSISSYNPAFAQQQYESRLHTKMTSHKYDNEPLVNEIIQKLLIQWSPEQIAGRNKAFSIETVSTSTIYRWIYEDKLPTIVAKSLRHKGKRRKHETRGTFRLGKRISTRPKEIYKRNIVGHWEGDTVVSSRGKSKSCIATFVERKSGLLRSVLMPDRTAKSMEQAAKFALSNERIFTMTVDRGKEFANYNEIEIELQIDVYFADGYCSWQKASNENTNGLIREYYPKKYCFNNTTQTKLKSVVELLNNRPRKRLNYLTPNEVYYKECCT